MLRAECAVNPPATKMHPGFEHVSKECAALHMPKQPIIGHGGRRMKNLCWVPVVAAIANTDCAGVLKTIYNCAASDEECPDDRMDPSQALNDFYDICCHTAHNSEDIYSVNECKETVKETFWENMNDAVRSSRPVVFLAESLSYKGYVHCLMLAGISMENKSMLVTDTCEQGVFQSDFSIACPKRMICIDDDAHGSLCMNVNISDKVCEQYRLLCVGVF